MSKCQWCRAMLWLLCVIFGSTCAAQPTGGRAGLSFLQLPANARLAALGSRHFTLPGAEASLFFQNPALLDSIKSKNLALSVMPYLADTRLVNLAYAQSFQRTKGTWGGGIQYLNYGTLTQTDDLGNAIGEFRAADYALSVGYGSTIQNITIGGSLKMVGSALESYRMWGLALDWGAVFKHPKRDLTAGFVVKNLGFLRQNYAGGGAPPLPLDVRIGLTFKPEYMPIRFSLTAHHLNAFDQVYNDPALFFDFDNNGNRVPRKIAVPEKLLRHLTAGAEILIHSKFRLMLGYDHLLRQEMRLREAGGLSGISFGGWLKVGRFEFSYGRSQMGSGLGVNTFSVNANLQK